MKRENISSIPVSYFDELLKMNFKVECKKRTCIEWNSIKKCAAAQNMRGQEMHQYCLCGEHPSLRFPSDSIKNSPSIQLKSNKINSTITAGPFQCHQLQCLTVQENQKNKTRKRPFSNEVTLRREFKLTVYRDSPITQPPFSPPLQFRQTPP